MSETVADEAEPVAEVIDYSKLSLEKRASHLPVPTYDYEAEYGAYCQRMGYTAEKMKSIRYKMTVYDEFRAEYDYRKRYRDVKITKTIERCRGKEARECFFPCKNNIKLHNIIFHEYRLIILFHIRSYKFFHLVNSFFSVLSIGYRFCGKCIKQINYCFKHFFIGYVRRIIGIYTI